MSFDQLSLRVHLLTASAEFEKALEEGTWSAIADVYAKNVSVHQFVPFSLIEQSAETEEFLESRC